MAMLEPNTGDCKYYFERSKELYVGFFVSFRGVASPKEEGSPLRSG